MVSNVSCADKGKISVTVRFRAYFSRDSALNMAQYVLAPATMTSAHNTRIHSSAVSSQWAEAELGSLGGAIMSRQCYYCFSGLRDVCWIKDRLKDVKDVEI